MAEHRIPAANWSDVLARTLRDATPGDVVIVRTEPMRLLAESAAQRMGKTGVTITVADRLED